MCDDDFEVHKPIRTTKLSIVRRVLDTLRFDLTTAKGSWTNNDQAAWDRAMAEVQRAEQCVDHAIQVLEELS